MRKGKFNTHYDRDKDPGEKLGGTTQTEMGFIPAKDQINNLLQAGANLTAYRRELYDYGVEDDPEEDSIDPTRNPNFDMADASEMAQKTARRLRQQKRKGEDAALDQGAGEAEKKDDEVTTEDPEKKPPE